MYPFLCAAIAITLFQKNRSTVVRRASSVLLLIFLAESASAYPSYLGYFNAAVGGPSEGHRYLLDSNLDWGQDLIRLAEYARTHEVQPLCLAYFGTASPDYYAIPSQPLHPIRTQDDLENTDCFAAVSVEYLYGIEERPLSMLENRAPIDRVGSSIYIYDLRRKK
jgi:hypothetical protein